MSKVRVLPDSLANQIAAGEVVERPASVVKELLENALDAGATRIDIEIETGGKRLIRIIDNGSGMSRDDAIVAFERHATSKLRSAEDLGAITTLGFRGEALPSIASVSRLTLRTRIDGDLEGTEVEFNAGKLTAVRDVAWPAGTEVEVRDLFLNVPARRKFLKSDSTESFHITNLVQHYALANPETAFLLINGGREVLNTSPVESVRERAYQILGGSLLNKLVEVKAESDGMSIYGFCSNPQEQRSSRDAQYLFVNRRFVKDRLIGKALGEAYRSMMPSGAYPATVLFVEIPPAEVDVNVHPAKTEVRFLHESPVLLFVRNAIAEALQATSPVTRVPQPARPTPADFPQRATPFERPIPAYSETSFEQASRPLTTPVEDQSEPGAFALESSSAVEAVRQHPLNLSFSSPAQTGAIDRENGDQTQKQDTEPALPNGSVRAEALPGFGHGIKPLGQIRDSYIVATDEEGLLLVDQHVAHERILFERFRDQRVSRRIEIQPFLLPETIDLTPAEADAYEAVNEELEESGVQTSRLSGRTIAIRSAPFGLGPSQAVALVREVLAMVESARRGFSLEDIRDEIAAELACKAAIKVNMALTQEKMQWLIDELLKTKNPMTCPHGRPILMRFELRDIERGFKRPV